MLRPGRCYEHELAIHVYLALGAPIPPEFARRWTDELRRAGQLELFAEPCQDVPSDQQLSLYPEWEERTRRRRYLSEHHFTLLDAAELMLVRGVFELYVLQAEGLSAATWAVLARLASFAEVHLFLVVSGRRPSPLQRRALRDCRVREREAPVPRGGLTPAWWSRATYRAVAAARAGRVPERLVLPQPLRPFDRFAAAAHAALNTGEHETWSFVPAEPAIPAGATCRISEAELAAAFRSVAERVLQPPRTAS